MKLQRLQRAMKVNKTAQLAIAQKQIELSMRRLFATSTTSIVDSRVMALQLTSLLAAIAAPTGFIGSWPHSK